MDDTILASQLKKTGNLMDLCNSSAWLKAIEEDEFDGAGTLGAGVGMRGYVEAVNSLTPVQLKQVKRQARLLHILFPELHQWVKSWNLGAGFEEAHTAARKILMERWTVFAAEHEDWVQALLVEDIEVEDPKKKAVRQQTKAKLAQMLNPDDWQVIANRAATAVEQNVLQIGQVEGVEIEAVRI